MTESMKCNVCGDELVIDEDKGCLVCESPYCSGVL